MRTILRAAAVLQLLFLLCAAAFCQTVLTTSTSATTPATLTPGSFIAVTLAPGPNTVTVDVAPGTTGSYTGQFALEVAYQGPTGPLRTWPSASISNSLSSGSTGISANATGAWSATVSGPGYVYLVLTSLSAGQPSVFLAAGQGGFGGVGGSGGGGGGTVTPGSGWSASGLATQTTLASILAVFGVQFPAALDGSGFFKVHEQGTLKDNGAGVFATFSTEYSNAVSTAASLTTYTSGALGSARLGVICTNTGTVDAWISTESGGHTWLCPAGGTVYVPVGNGVAIYGLSTGAATTVYCKEFGY